MPHSAFHAGWDATWADGQRARFGLAPDREIRSLSKGETGKLMILLALAQRPSIVRAVRPDYPERLWRFLESRGSRLSAVMARKAA